MSKDYLCKNCIENNNGWCNKLKKQGLKQITSCEHYNDRLGIAIPAVNDITSVMEACQQPIKSITLDEKLGNGFEENLKLMQARALIESHYEWRKWCQEIPYIKFPENWEVKAIPPFGGVIIRYIIKHENPNSERISIYLDCYGELGIVDEPYWEIYPDIDGDAYRCRMNDIEDLLERLHIILDRFD